MAQHNVDYPNENTKRVLERMLTEMGYKDFNISLSTASEKGDNYMGLIYRATVEAKSDNDISILRFILKVTPNYDRDKFPLRALYDREMYSYNTMLPIMASVQEESKIPKNERFPFVKIYTTDSTDKEEILVMEDLMENDFVMVSRTESLNYEHVMFVLKRLAYLHAISFKLKQDNMEKFNELAGNLNQGIELNELFKKIIDLSVLKAVNLFEEGSDKEKLKQFQANGFSIFRDSLMGDMAQPYTVICHGDCWINNMLFKYQDGKLDDIRFVDWQLTKRSSPAVDLFNFIFASTDEKVRENFQEFLNYYYDTLKSSLNRYDCNIDVCYPREVFDKQVQMYLPYGLVMGLLTAPVHLNDKDDVPDYDDVFKKDKEVELSFIDIKNTNTMKKYESRVRGLVRDAINYGAI